jgi:hypothetical protein
MSWGLVAVAGATLVGGAISSNAQKKAGQAAADAQTQAADAGIAEQQRQFNAIQKLLQPYVTGGQSAFTGQQNLIGLGGAQAQKAAINSLQQSPQFTSLVQTGENAILQNASATGGLRGGNTQAALAQFRPQLLSQLIDQQYARLGGLSSLGQNAAAGVGNAGMTTGSNIGNLMQQRGAAIAGGALAGGQANAGYGQVIGQLGGLAGSYFNRPGVGGGGSNFDYGSIGGGFTAPDYGLGGGF